MKILIVEDNEDSRNLLVKQLRAYGYEVTATANGAEALEQALAHPPEIIVSDIMMPKMDGYQLCHEFKQNDKLKGIPFVFYTATYTLDEDKKFALSLGADAFILKPSEPDALAQTLQQVFEKAKSGALAPPEVAPLEPSLFLTEYSKRIFAKLEHKVAQLEESEKKLKYIGSVLRAIRDINQLMVRERDRAKLLSGACEILIKVREYKFAWIGLIEEGHKRVLPVAQAGVEKGYLSSVKITWDNTETGKGPTGTAIKTKQPSLMKNTPEDPGYEPWREEALKRGYLSAAAIPLVHGEKVYGALNVYSSQRDSFNDEEIQLLVEVSSDLAFALKAIDEEEEHRQADEKIKHAAEEWRTTFDSITDLVSICSKDFKLIRVNKAFAGALKMKPQEVLGKLCYTLVHGTNEPIPNCPYKQTLEDGKPHMAEYFEPHLGIHLEESISPILNEKGEVVACVHVAKDITKHKRMEEQLMVTDRLASIGELASGIAHELNNPLTSVIGFSQLLMEKDVADDVKEDVKIICSEAQRTAEIVKGFLTFARKHAPVKQLVNINSIIEKVLELRAYEQKVSNIQVNILFASDLPEIMVDYFQLQQAFLNIIINAEYFMIEAHNKGTLTITTERTGDVIRISFADDGPGISKDNTGHLFDPFFTTKEVGKGTGLGLSICHGTITEHGGRICAESESGKGATFIVELPITIDNEGAVK